MGRAILAKHYKDLHELTADATLIVEGTVTSTEREETIGAAKFKVRTINLTHVLAGRGVRTADPASVAVRFPDEGTDTTDLPAFHKGQAVLMYLVPFVFDRSQPTNTGEYVLVGGPQGLFYNEANGHWRASWPAAPPGLSGMSDEEATADARPSPGPGLGANVPPAIRVLSGQNPS